MLIPVSAVLTSLITAFYISRLIFKVFFGSFRLGDKLNKLDVHESPKAMRYVLVVLAVFCLFFVFSYHPLHYQSAWILEGFVSIGEDVEIYHTLVPLTVNIAVVLVVGLAYTWYVKRKAAPNFSKSLVYRFTNKQWYFNELYQRLVIHGTTRLSAYAFLFDRVAVDGVINYMGKAGLVLSSISDWIDHYIIDGMVNAMASMAKTIGNFARHFQTGRLQHYLLSMVLVVLTFFIINYFLG